MVGQDVLPAPPAHGLPARLQSEALRREAHEGLNVVENWNGANAAHLLRQGR